MRLDAIPDSLWAQLSEFIAEKMGLNFPPDRRADLQRGLAGAAQEFGFSDTTACMEWLLTGRLTKAQLLVLASHLTVGETYFFRERKIFDVLSVSVLPELLRTRREQGRRLRVWSAACCTGEEPYSLAIMLRQAISDLADWRVTILATDINQRFLEKAAEGVYGEWSFRESPDWFKDRYFHCTLGGQYALRPEIRKMVTFAHLNLVEDTYPALATDTNAMDLIFCRNALMYFTAPQAKKVVRKLHRSLVDDGWMVVSAGDGTQALQSDFTTVNFPGVILHKKCDPKTEAAHPWMPAFSSEPATFRPMVETPVVWTPPAVPPAEPLPVLQVETPVEPESPPTPCEIAAGLYQEGRYAEAAETLLAAFAENEAPDPKAFSLLAHALANQGRLADALSWCDRWVAADKLDSASHYLRAVVLQELGESEKSRSSFQRAIYLEPSFVLAHFALGNLARGSGKNEEAEKHFDNAARLLRGLAPDDPLPESDGLTAGRLTEIIASIAALETVS